MKTLALLLLLSSALRADTVIQDADGQRIYGDDGSVVIQNSRGQQIIQGSPGASVVSSTYGENSPIISSGRSVSISSSNGKSVMVVNGVRIVVNEDGEVRVNGKKCEVAK